MSDFEDTGQDKAEESAEVHPADRREFIRTAGLMAFGAAAAGGALFNARVGKADAHDVSGSGSIRKLNAATGLPGSAKQDVIVRMQVELERAMAKPVEQRHWVMVIDSRKCIGCSACTLSCVAENKLPPGVVYRPVVTEESGKFPNTKLKFTPKPCMHCEKPPCVPVCPVSATWKRVDGIVAIDYDKCIGCRYCLTACPYGARTADFGESYTKAAAAGVDTSDEHRAILGGTGSNEQRPSHEYHKSWDRNSHDSPVGNARKCHFCLHRLEHGQLPACTTSCIGRATFFGDSNDPDSLVSELIAKNDVQTLLPHAGTKPSVYYIV